MKTAKNIAIMLLILLFCNALTACVGGNKEQPKQGPVQDEAEQKEIDEINILEADFLAMRRALQALGMPGISESAPEIPVEVKGSFAEVAGTAKPKVFIAVDGNLKIRNVPAELQMPIVKGDGRIASISAASILAKVFRDRFMDKLAETYPGYAFEVNAGYGTKAHLDGIRKHGFTPAHRRSFHPKGLE